MKKLKPAYILSFVIAFTIFIYEPIVLYASNKTDLWFDFKSMLKPMILLFIILFAFIMLFYAVINKFSKKKKVYNVILVISFITFFASYIQGNYLIGDLPPLDGTTIVWKGFLLQNIITICVWLIIIAAYILCIRKFKFDKVLDVSKKITLVIFIMLSVSMLTTLLTTKDMFLEKKAVDATPKYFTTLSSDKNLIVFLVDAVDSKTFEKIRKDSKYKDTFEDFTYYPDTLAYYPFTRDSIPLILSGVPNHNKEDFYNYYNKAMDKSPLMDELIKNKYNINIYDYELGWSTKKSENVTNSREVSNSIRTSRFAVHELKYVGYKYLPYFLKKFVKIENMNFNYTKTLKEESSYSWDNVDNYKVISKEKVEKDKQKFFKFIHVEGAHVPFDEDEELNKIDENEGTYEQKVASSLKLINSYINWLKENDVYDNSAIVILADHGYDYENIIGRQNPILYIKGIDEEHDMRESDKKVSYLDLANTFIDLMNGKKTDELFEDIDDDRERKFIWYEYTKENNMVEYVQTGNAWDKETAKTTGKKYKR
ncbi:MAG: sulfatase-like hydrolase/transferase [Bacilli bacterium]|nr:sulfatase-like hydrolase/transferase [Bacilli bacterium]